MKSIIKSHTNTYKNLNEDYIYASENISFVIDGASGLSGNNHIKSSSNDVVWFVDFWKDYLMENLSDHTMTIADIVSKGVDKVLNSYKDSVDDFASISKYDYPSASIAIIRKTKSAFEYFVLGDCTAIFKLRDNNILKLKDDRVSRFDQKVISLIETRRHDLEYGSFKFTEDERELLLSNRMRKNTPGGYFILEFDKKAIREAICGSIAIDEVKEFILSSDGFSISHETYGIVKENELFNVLKLKGPSSLIDDIRRLELEDDSIKRFPRLKLHDDCSVMHYENLHVN